MPELEIGLMDLPAPGEPITPKIHEENQRLLDEEAAARAARVRAKLTKKQLRKLETRYEMLRKRLIAGQWNALIKRRWDLYQDSQQIKHEIQSTTGIKKKNLELELASVRAEGKKLDAAVRALQPIADEFEEINNKKKAHFEVLAWEKEDNENRAKFRQEATVWLEQIKATCRQSPRLHHKWEDTRGNVHYDIPRFGQPIFKEDRVYYHIKTTSQNPIMRFFGRWQHNLPYGVDIKDLTCEETLENLSNATGRTVTIERSKNGINLFWVISRLDSPDGIPRKILYEKILDHYPAGEHEKTPWAAGVSNERKIAWFNFRDHPHVLIAGTTQSGKSNHVNQMIALMATMNTPRELRFVLIDNKGGVEFTHWRGLRHLLMPMIKSAGEVPGALKKIRGLMERRLALFESTGAKNLESFNEKVKEENRLPRIITIIDEMATLISLGQLTTDIQTELRAISSQGRAVGIHLILCTQHPSHEVLPGWIKTNMGVRVAGRMPGHVGSMIILDSVTAATLPDIPGRLVFSMGRNETIAQSPYISDASIARAVALAKEFPAAPNDELEALVSKEPVKKPKEKFSREEFFEIVMDHLEGKISAKNVFDHLGGNQNDVISLHHLRIMVKQIIDDGLENGILYKGSHYRLKKVSGRGNYSMVPSEGISEEKSDGDTEEFQTFTSSEESETVLA